MTDSPTSKKMRTFSFDGEGIYEMPEGVGEYVLASDARAEIERLRAERDKWQARAMALFWTGGDADGVTCADIRKATDGYNEWLKRSHAPDETTPSPQAPIARVIVSEDAPAQVLLYAPGLPIGEHDLYCEPTGRVKSISQELRERGFPRRDRLPNDDVPEKASALPSATLADFGYAPGVYAFHCLDCDQEELGDKRSIRCKSCAEKALAALNGSAVTNEEKK